MKQNIFSCLPGALLPWYEKNQRDLPWRQDRDPYHIWVSEIMLQQTRVEAVKGYYARFIAALPTISALANADDDLLNKLWEGLGYYSRVRNMKKAARQIMEQYGGAFPEKIEDILALPGIGPYTAGALCSIAYDQPTPAVDGNVLRVVSRLIDDATPIDLPAYKKTVETSLAVVYPRQAGAFTQALMELGATVCGPNRKPDCQACPCREFCLGHANGTADTLPVKSPKRPRRVENMTVFILSYEGRFALEKRGSEGLLAGLWQFPNTPGMLDIPKALQSIKTMGLQPKDVLRQMEKKHIFTHVQWQMRGICVEVKKPSGDFTWFTQEEIDSQAALPTAFRQFWEEVKDV